MRVCVDTTILIDILKDEFRKQQKVLYTALSLKAMLVAPTVVFAELTPQFNGDAKQIKSFLGDHKIQIEPLDLESVTHAGLRWMNYLKRKSRLKCPECGNKLNVKAHFLSDFYIGGFASAKCDSLLTRDRGIYGKYFPELHMYAPSDQ